MASKAFFKSIKITPLRRPLSILTHQLSFASNKALRVLCSERKPDWPLFNKHFHSDIDIAGHTHIFLTFSFLVMLSMGAVCLVLLVVVGGVADAVNNCQLTERNIGFLISTCTLFYPMDN